MSSVARAARRPIGSRREVPYAVYLVPGGVLFAAIILFPFAMNIYLSLTSWRGIGPVQFIGFDNYARLFGDAIFWTSFRNSIAMIVAMVVVPTLLGLGLAAILFDYIGRRFSARTASTLRALYYLPQILPVAVVGILWSWILNPQTGALNVVLRAIGLDQLALNWLGATSTALPTVMAVMVWVQIGYPVVIFMAALQRVDPELYEAAEVDGAGWWARFRAITLPQIKPETFVVTLTCTIAALKVFGPIYVLTGGGPENSTNVPSYFAYQNFFPRSQVGYGAAIATVLTVVVVIVTIVFMVLQARSEAKEREGAMSSTTMGTAARMATEAPRRSRRGRPRDRFHRGAGRWVVLVVITLGAIAMMLPFVIMLLNAFKSPVEYSNAGPLSFPTSLYFDGLVNFWNRVNYPEKLMNSIIISACVAVFGVLISLLNAYAIGIGRIRGRTWLIGLFLLANMIPQEALLYPLYFGARQIGLYNSIWAVVIIFTVVQSAFGTYLLSSVMSTFPPALLEAARIDGASRWTILWRVVFPIVRPTMSVLMIFFFIWTWNEFYIPLVMLIDNSTQTIPVALAALQGDRLMDVPTINAGSLISLLPAVIFFLIFQRTLARGVTAGSVK